MCLYTEAMAAHDSGPTLHLHRATVSSQRGFLFDGFRFELEDPLPLTGAVSAVLKVSLSSNMAPCPAGALWSGKRRHYPMKIKFQSIGKFRIGSVHFSEKSLGTHIGFRALDHFLRTAGETHVTKCFTVHREKSNSCTVFRRHVANRGAIGQWHAVQAFAIELHRFVLTVTQMLRKNGVVDKFVEFYGEACS